MAQGGGIFLLANESNRSTAISQHWSSQNQNAKYPNTVVLNTYLPDEFSGRGFTQSAYRQRADFMRIKNISLGYSLPNRIVPTSILNDLRIYINLSNPFVFSNFEGSDPEVTGGYPMQKSYTIGLTAKF